MSVESLVSSGPLLLAMPVAVAAGALTFLSPCVLPLVPGYLSYITGMSGASAVGGASSSGGDGRPGADRKPGAAPGRPAATAPGYPGQPAAAGAAAVATVPASGAAPGSAAGVGAAAPAGPTRRRAAAGAALFILGFSALFAAYGAAFGQIGFVLEDHRGLLTRVLGVILILLGLLFAGALDRFSFAGRIVKPSVRPRAGLATAPLLGVLFGVGWTPCAGPTLSAVLLLGESTGTAARGALLAFVYALGVGVPFLIVAVAVERGVTVFGFARRHARTITRIGGLLLIAVGVLEVTGAWSSAIAWLQAHWASGYNSPL